MRYPFIESPNVTRVGGRTIDTIVIHTIEIVEVENAAERCARWFASPRSEVSAHYCVDADSVIQCVREEDVAWHARGGNRSSIGVELAGTAKQTTEEWADAYSAAVLVRAAELVAEVALRHDVPVRRIGPVGLQRGARGITGHADVSQAFRKSDHWDPGPGFPWARFLADVRVAARARDLRQLV
jgi:N-acetyl-anhydromuramyl-L-alanine amidase AmpD